MIGMSVGSSEDYDTFVDSLDSQPRFAKLREAISLVLKEHLNGGKENGGSAFARTSDGRYLTSVRNAG